MEPADYDFAVKATGEITVFELLPIRIFSGFAASPNRKLILHVRHDWIAARVVLAELGK